MSLDARVLRPYAPLLVLLATIGAGWMVVIRPLSADRSRAAGQIVSLRQRETALRRELSAPAPPGVDTDPAAAFERQVASGNASPALVEQLARLASAARARNLLIETMEGPAATAPDASAPEAAGRAVALQRDPRLSLFDIPVSHLPIRLAFDTDYASLGRFLWALRNLPTTVEIRSLFIGPAPPASGDENASARTDILRASLTLHAYSRSAPAVVQSANTSRNGAAR